MKKILCYLLILCMMPLYGICLTADDSVNFNFSLSFSPIDEEGIVTVSVHVTDNPGFCALKLLLRYDNTVLRPVPRSDKRNLYQGMLTINANNANVNLETMSQYSVVGSGTSTVSKDGELFSFQMQILPNTQAETLITCDAPSYVSTIDYASYDIVMEDTAFSLQYPQIIVPAENGEISLSQPYAAFGDEVTVDFAPDRTFMPNGFLLDGTPQEGNTYIAQGIHKVCALFTPIPYDISVDTAEHGTVIVDIGQGIIGQTVTLSAIPDDHYVLDYFTLDGEPLAGNTFSITGPHTVSASFIPAVYTVTAKESSGGTFSVSAQEGIFGTQVNLTATPDLHHHFSHYLLDGEVWEEPTFVITKNHTVSAVFTPILYDISIHPTENGSITADKAQGQFGQTVTLSATPMEHYVLAHFLLDGTPLEGNTFSVTGNHTVSASFIPTVYTVTAETVVGGTISLSESSGIFSTQITVTATPDAEYNLKHILLDGEVLEGSSFSISKNHTVSALFERKNTVMVTVDIDGKGLVTGAGSFTIGESVTLKATPASKYTFSGWYVGEKKVSTKKEYSFVAEKDIFVEAVFKKSGGGGGGGGNSMPAPVVPVPQTMGLRANTKEIRFMTAANGQFMPDRAATRYEVIEALDALFFVPETTQSFSLSDVDSAHADIVARFMASGILHGYEDGTFRGETPITRAELCKVLCVLLSLDTATKTTEFTDVASDFWGSPYIAAIANKGYVLGYEDHSFRPNNNITRAELTVLLSRIAGTKTTAPHPSLSDIDATHWAYETVLVACKHE